MAEGIQSTILGWLGIAAILIVLTVVTIIAIIDPYLMPIFTLIIYIVLYESLVGLDLSGSLHQLSSVLLSNQTKSAVSLVPNPTVDKSAQRQMFKMDTPFRVFIQVGRGLLYFAFFAFLMTTPLVSSFFNMPYQAEGYIFVFINNIVGIEILAISIALVLVVIDNFLDIISIAVS